MRPLDLNLASRPFRNNTLPWIGYGLLAAGVVGFTAWNTVTFVETGRTLAEARNTVGSIANREEALELREQHARAEIARYDVKYLSLESLRANDVILRKAMSWTRLFNLLEATQPYEVRMVSVRPTFGTVASRGALTNPATGSESIPVAVDGTAKDLRAFLDFERALIRDEHFDRVEPVRTTHSKGGELLFSLSFLYSPEGRAGGEGADEAQAKPESAAEENAAAEAETNPGMPQKAPPSSAASTVANKVAADVPDSTAQAPTATPAGLVAKPTVSPPAAPSAPNVAAPSPQADGNPVPADAEFMDRLRHKPKSVPQGPIRKRPPGWQPPDPFAKEKKEGEKNAPAAGERK